MYGTEGVVVSSQGQGGIVEVMNHTVRKITIGKMIHTPQECDTQSKVN